MRVLGIDYGSKRVGVALGDTETGIATAWAVLPNEGLELLAARIAEIAKKEEAACVVVGIPKPLRDASLENAQVQEIRGVMVILREAGLVVEEWDEGYSSAVAAQHEVAGRGMTAAGRTKSRGEKRDDLAAAVMLEGWLSRKVS
jgi:putative Holliday junction resolvase